MDQSTSDENTTTKEPQQCQICNRAFLSATTLKRHEAIHRRTPLIYNCDICGKQLKNYSGFSQHRRKHAEQVDIQVNNCDICGKFFVSKGNLMHHIKKLHENGKARQKCETCGIEVFNIRSHWRIHRQRDRPTCDVCGKDFSCIGNLEIHKKQKHSNNLQTFSCDKCDKTFVVARRLKRHIEHYHSDIKEKCKICKKEFKHLKMHMKNHLSPEVDCVSCEICGKQFTKQKYLLQHSKLHDPNRKVFSCDVCAKSFKTKFHLQRHSETHSDPKYFCDTCDLSFHTADALRMHSKKHQNPRKKKEKCNLCYKEVYSIERHMENIHYHKELRFRKKQACTECDKMLYPEHIEAHVKLYHQNVKNMHNFQESVAGKREACSECDVMLYPKCIAAHMKLKHPNITNH